VTPVRLITPRGHWRELPDILERRNVTICIAAECFNDANRCLILCTDWRVSSALGRSDTKVKHIPIRKNWWALTAGNESDILALRLCLSRHFLGAKEIDETSACVLVRSALTDRKREKIEEFIQGRYAISYADFLNFGKDKLPPEAHREAVSLIAQIQVGASLIVAGFNPDGTVMLLDTNEQGRVFVREDFTTIGEGSYLAQAALLQREYTSASELAAAIYCVYEAKKISERVTSVGEDEQLSILYTDGTFRDVSDAGLKLLENTFNKFGPQKVKKSELSAVESLLGKSTLRSARKLR
jgi:20S proteasome alpha/beta subunit